MKKTMMYAIIIAIAVAGTAFAGIALPSMMGRGHMTTIIQALKSGNFDLAKNTVLAALTGENPYHSRYNLTANNNELRNALREAFQNKDYAAYKDAATQLNLTRIFTEQDFNSTASNSSYRGRWAAPNRQMP